MELSLLVRSTIAEGSEVFKKNNKKEAHGRFTRASFNHESNIRVPQGSPPYQHSMPMRDYKISSSAFSMGSASGDFLNHNYPRHAPSDPFEFAPVSGGCYRGECNCISEQFCKTETPSCLLYVD
jgi:hypothetical protein